MAVKTYPFDPAKYLTTAEHCAAYLTDALQTNDSAAIADALGGQYLNRAPLLPDLIVNAATGREQSYKPLQVSTA